MERVMMIPMTVSIAPSIDFTIQTPVNVNLGIDTAIVVGGSVPYEGDYIVTPKAHAQTVLPTKRKVMADDVTVLEIPYWETSNPDGKTVYIAEEVEFYGD